MRGLVVVEDESDYQAWLQEQSTFADQLAEAKNDAGDETRLVMGVDERSRPLKVSN